MRKYCSLLLSLYGKWGLHIPLAIPLISQIYCYDIKYLQSVIRSQFKCLPKAVTAKCLLATCYCCVLAMARNVGWLQNKEYNHTQLCIFSTDHALL